jgi:hypothetical protein
LDCEGTVLLCLDIFKILDYLISVAHWELKLFLLHLFNLKKIYLCNGSGNYRYSASSRALDSCFMSVCADIKGLEIYSSQQRGRWLPSGTRGRKLGWLQ